MKMMRFTALCLSALLLTACGGNGDPKPSDSSAEVSAETSNEVSTDESSELAGISSADESDDDIVIGTEELSPPDISLDGYVYDTDNLSVIEGFNTVGIYKYKGNATKLIIPSEINGKPVDKIYFECFFGKTDLEGVYIEDGIKEIGDKAFYKCIKLREIRFPNTLENINYAAFYECIGLKEVYVPDSIVKISSDAFYGCSSLKSVRLPADIKYLYSSFTKCTALSGTAIIPAGGTKIYSVYSGCTGIKNLMITGGQVLNRYVFEGMTGLEEVHIPESVVELEDIDKLFRDQIHLKKIYVVDGSYAAYALADSIWGEYLCSEVAYE